MATAYCEQLDKWLQQREVLPGGQLCICLADRESEIIDVESLSHPRAKVFLIPDRCGQPSLTPHGVPSAKRFSPRYKPVLPRACLAAPAICAMTVSTSAVAALALLSALAGAAAENAVQSIDFYTEVLYNPPEAWSAVASDGSCGTTDHFTSTVNASATINFVGASESASVSCGV